MLAYIRANPGTTALAIAAAYPVENRTHGRVQAVNAAIARLRRQGELRDCANRCELCGGATTRGHRNVPLYTNDYREPVAVAA